MESYVADVNADIGKTTIVFTLREKAGALAETLKLFQVSHEKNQTRNVRGS